MTYVARHLVALALFLDVLATVRALTDDDDRQADAVAAYPIAPPEAPLGYYSPNPDLSVEVALDYYVNGDDGAHPSSAYDGFLHYLPPAAISKKYYALQDPNVYPTGESDNASYTPSTTTTAFDSASSPTITDTL